MTRVSLNLIVRDDAVTLRPLLEKLRPHVDEICISDTGSVDDTPSIARNFADKFDVYLDCNDQEERIEDFANARNHVLDMATGDAIMWLDADDDFIGAEHIRRLCDRPEESFMLLVPYEYTHDASGRCTCLHWRETIVKPRDKCRWSIPVHEVLLPGIPIQYTGPAPELRRIHKKHLSTKVHEPGRNLRILDKYVATKREEDVRALYYYGVELHHAGRIGESLRVLNRYVELSQWPDERCLAQLEIARIHHHRIGNHQEAINWALRAMVEKSWPDPYWLISSAFFALACQGIEAERNSRRSLHFAELGSKLPDAQTVLFVNPQERFEVHRHVNQLHAQRGDIESALQSCRDGLAGLPGDPELMTRVLLYEDILTKNRIIVEVNKSREITGQLRERGQFDAAQWAMFGQMIAGALEVAPQLPPAAVSVVEVAEQPVADGCLDIVFFLGEAYERWNPITLAAGGMGGSETMAWELARRLRGLGHRIRVYSDCDPSQEGVFDGVEWLQTQKFPGVSCDVLITSRRPDAVDAGVKARARLLWVHDVHAGDALTQSRALRIDRILALSHWHKWNLLQTYSREKGAPYPIANLHPDDVHVTRNGIDLARFDADAPRNPKRLVYSSSPDRGLTTLLEMWPAILAAEPEAELHVYYGFDGWEKAVATNPAYANSHRFIGATALRRLKHQLKMAPRVTMHGRVSGEKLAREFLSSGVWAYPTWFSETNCITAYEAQVAGLYIVTTPVAALNETAGNRGVRVPGGWETNDGPTEAARQEFIAATVRALREESQPMTREALQTFARENFSLDALAADWDREIRELVDRVDSSIVPRFRDA